MVNFRTLCCFLCLFLSVRAEQEGKNYTSAKERDEGPTATLNPELLDYFRSGGATPPHSKTEQEKEDSVDSLLGAVEAEKILKTITHPQERKALEKGLEEEISRDKIKFDTDKMASLKLISFLVDWVNSAYGWANPYNILFAFVLLLKIALIVLIFTGFWRASDRCINSYMKKLISPPGKEDPSRNRSTFAKTVAPIIQSITHWILSVLGFLLILSELEINITPLIYSFSVIGLAISIGSQTLVKDLINGIMTLFEGNMDVGDKVTIGENTGIVESISLRCVHLRHKSGKLQTIPFSEITSVSNFSRDYNVVQIQFMVSYETDLRKVFDILLSIYSWLKADPRFLSLIKGDLECSVSSLTAWGPMITATIKTTPDPGPALTSEFYKKLVCELQEAKISLPASLQKQPDSQSPFDL